jgi:hypothetical protein
MQYWAEWYVMGSWLGLINNIDSEAKCCHLKKFTRKGTLRQEFIFSPWFMVYLFVLSLSSFCYVVLISLQVLSLQFTSAFFASAIFASAFFASVFYAIAFFASAFLVSAFFASSFFASAFFASAFHASAFCASAFFASAPLIAAIYPVLT